MRRTLLFVLISCGDATPGPRAPETTPDAGAHIAVEAGVATLADSGGAAPVALPWFEDDYPKALATAKAKNLPLFVDASAIWCHTCKSMRVFVLDDAALPKASFVWTTFDVEKESNAEAAKKYPTNVLPTFFVVDPADESVHGRWEGAGTVPQMRGFLQDAKQSIELAHAGNLKADDPLALLLAGHRAEMQQNHDEAEKNFVGAIAAAPAKWPRLPDALLALIVARKRGQKFDSCVALAADTLATDRLGRTSVLADFSDTALACARKGQQGPAVTKVRTLVAQKVLAAATDPAALMSADDRGDALSMVVDAKEDLGDHAGALEAAKLRLDVLEKASKATPDAAIAETYDGARMETLEFLGRPQDAIGFLTEHEKELSTEYNPSHRLAHIYYALGKYPDALAAIDRAISRAWGARKGQMYTKKADILLKMGKKPEAKAALQDALKLYKSLPDGQRKPSLEKAVEERLK
jgi:tetratricopeptide (TPR) repeat protein